ncbi:MAG: bifunctional metallophosphatase/5'-nucleotidase [Clostridia bacterium]|nr:bifunctional metallophosphatase/5'-nucleotidase [Clostridia bacterium]
MEEENIMKEKLLALLLALIMVLSAVPALADFPAAVFPTDYTGKTVILHSNDVHGALDGYAYIPALRDWFTAHGAADVLTVDAGDFSQGTIYVSTNKGAAAIDMMNAAGYDIVTLGNHEFDFGYDQLMENLSKAEFLPICANVILDETGESILDEAVVCSFYSDEIPEDQVTDEDIYLKVGFVGLETPETATKVNPGLISNIHFTTFDDLYTYAQETINAVKEAGADLVIGVFHLGVDNESAANGYRSIDVYNKVTGLDFIIDGHSHTVMTAYENGEPIQSTGTKFANIGVIVIDNETKTIENHFLVDTKGLEKDPEVAAKAQEIIDAVDAEYGATFATSEVVLNGERAPGNRTEETNLGDLITDAMVWSVVKEGGIEQVEPNHVIGITNGGGIRAAVNVGDVSMKDINTVLPFGNTVVVIYVTGEELLEVLEASTFCTPDSIGGYPQTSGITWTLDTTKSFDQGEVYTLDGKESSYFKPASIQRVTIEKINGEDFDPAATYAVVTNNFCAAGGDTYNAFARAYNEGSGFDTGIPMDEAVMAFIKDVLEGKITEEAYGAPRGTETQIK